MVSYFVLGGGGGRHAPHPAGRSVTVSAGPGGVLVQRQELTPPPPVEAWHDTMPERFIPGNFILIFLMGFLIVAAIGAVARKRPRWGVAIAAIAFIVAGMGFTVVLREGGGVHGHRPAGLPAPVPAPSRAWPARQAEPASAPHRIEAPDDIAAWARDGILGFQPSCDWLPAEAARHEETIGDTEFVYFEPVDRRLLGLSGQEAEREAAFQDARRSAEEKLAVLALVVLKREDRRADAASAHALAVRIARKFYEEEKRHLQKARRPYGDVYRAAVVAKAGTSQVNGLASEVRKELARGWVQRQRAMTSWLLAIGAALVIGFAIFLFYTFANAGTKGYFAWPLRIASLALFVLLCAGLFYLRVRLGTG
jgi:hypothetical protein